MKRFIPFLLGLGVLIMPQLGVMANEATTEAVNRDNQQLLYDQAIAIDGAQPLAWEQRGDALTQKGQYQAALEAYNEALNVSEEKQPQLQEKLETTREKRAQQLR